MADILTLAQARAALGWPDASHTADDAELSTLYIPAVTQAVEHVCGRMVDRRESWRTDDTAPLTTPWAVATIKAVSVGDYKLPVTGWSFSAPTLTITDSYYTAGDVVTVIAGGLPTPAGITLVARRVLAAKWNADHQGTGGARPDSTASITVALSAQDMQDLDPWRIVGGFG